MQGRDGNGSGRPRGRWRWLILVAIALASGAVYGTVRALGPQVAAVQVSRRALIQTVIVSGRVLPPARINVGTTLLGVARSVAVREGDHVRAGDLLVQLDDAEQQAAVALARAGLSQARARLRQLKHIALPIAREQHRQADANLELAQLSFERQAALAQQGSATQAQLDEARRALQIAQSQHDSTDAQAKGSGPHGAEHAIALAAYAQAAAQVAQAEARAAQTRIVAQTPALVLTRSVEPGELVQPGRTILILARDGETQLSVQPDEKNLAELRLEQAAQASADAFPQDRFPARVSYIAPAVDPQRGTIEVRFVVEQPPAYLRPDMTVSVNIEVGRRDAALVVPKDAVQDIAGAPWVWAVRDGRARRCPVDLGLRDDRSVEVRRGLSDGDIVVSSSPRPLREGQRVRPRAPAGGGRVL